ncbi:MAG: methyltransferase domain-containing protein [Deltaproteobacteria bacterium]|nr:methyltransferase domain-containing protein [Deltaproteobacteria bacterium]
MILMLMVITFVGSLCSLLYELNLAKSVAHLTGNVILWEAVTVGSFLGALGLGVLEQSKRVASWHDLFHLELKLSLGGAFSIPLILFFHVAYRIYLADVEENSGGLSALTVFGLLCQIPSLVLGFYSGRELPIFLSLGKGKTPQLLSASYMGALAASCLFTLGMQSWEFTQVALATGLGNLLLAAFINWQRGFLKTSIGWWSLGASLLALGAFAWTQGKINEWHLKNFYYNHLRFSHDEKGIQWEGPVGLGDIPEFASHQGPLRRVRSPYQFIDYVWQPASEDQESFSLYLNGHYQFSSAREKNYHRTMVHAPLALVGKIPEQALVLGAGDGLLVRELLKYNDASITLVELDSLMLEEAKKEPLSLLNQQSLSDKRVDIVVADAFRWLQTTDRSFDAIFADFPYPFDGESSRLFTVEFYKLLGKALAAGGFVVANYPLLEASGSQAFAIASQTFHDAGFVKVWWFSVPGESFILATRHPASLKSTPSDLQVVELPGESGYLAHSILKPHHLIATDPFF